MVSMQHNACQRTESAIFCLLPPAPRPRDGSANGERNPLIFCILILPAILTLLFGPIPPYLWIEQGEWPSPVGTQGSIHF